MSGATSLEDSTGPEEKLLDTSIWKIQIKAGNSYKYIINVEDEAAGKTTRNILNLCTQSLIDTPCMFKSTHLPNHKLCSVEK